MPLYLDTETTGLGPSDRIIEIGVVDDSGSVVFESLIDPRMPIPVDATAIHGITDAMVSGAPVLQDIIADLRHLLLSDGMVVIYNAEFDTRFFPKGFWLDLRVECALERYALVAGRRRKLQRAAKAASYRFETAIHRAVADARACRAVWHWLEQHQAPTVNRYSNIDPDQLALRAWNAHQRAAEANSELRELKNALIALTGGEKRAFVMEGQCRITISALIDSASRRSYKVDPDALAALDPPTRRLLFDLGVIRRSENEGREYQIVRFTDLRDDYVSGGDDS